MHGTPDDASIGYSRSHGCIRMHIPDAEWLFDHVARRHAGRHPLALAAFAGQLDAEVGQRARSKTRERRRGRRRSAACGRSRARLANARPSRISTARDEPDADHERRREDDAALPVGRRATTPNRSLRARAAADQSRLSCAPSALADRLRHELHLRRRVHRRVPRLPLHASTPATSSSGSIAAAVKLGLVEANELDEEETRDLVALAAQGVIEDPESRLGRYLVRNWERVVARRRRVARLLAAQARLPRRLARPPGQARRARDRLGRRRGRVRLPASRAAAGRCSSSRRCRRGTSCSSAPLTARDRSAACSAPPRASRTSRVLLARRPLRDVPAAARARRADVASCCVALLTRVPVERRAQALGVVVLRDDRRGHRLADLGRLHATGSHNLPMFVPPAHGLVFLTGLSLALALARGTRALVVDRGRGRGRDLGRARPDRAAAPRRRRRARRAAAAALPLALAQPRDLRRRLPRRRRARALRHRDRHLALGAPSCPASASRTATRRRASPPATSGST